MENFRELIMNAVDNTLERVIKQDVDYQNLEELKTRILSELKSDLSAENFDKVEKIVDCMDGQNFITAMGFSFVRVLDIQKFC